MPFRLPILQSVALPALAHFFDGVTFRVHGLVSSPQFPSPKIGSGSAGQYYGGNSKFLTLPTVSKFEQLGRLGFAVTRPGSCHTWP